MNSISLHLRVVELLVTLWKVPILILPNKIGYPLRRLRLLHIVQKNLVLNRRPHGLRVDSNDLPNVLCFQAKAGTKQSLVNLIEGFVFSPLSKASIRRPFGITSTSFKQLLDDSAFSSQRHRGIMLDDVGDIIRTHPLDNVSVLRLRPNLVEEVTNVAIDYSLIRPKSFHRARVQGTRNFNPPLRLRNRLVNIPYHIIYNTSLRSNVSIPDIDEGIRPQLHGWFQCRLPEDNTRSNRGSIYRISVLSSNVCSCSQHRPDTSSVPGCLFPRKGLAKSRECSGKAHQPSSCNPPENRSRNLRISREKRTSCNPRTNQTDSCKQLRVGFSILLHTSCVLPRRDFPPAVTLGVLDMLPTQPLEIGFNVGFIAIID